MKQYLAALWLLLLPLWAAADSNTATDELLASLQEMQQLQGAFEQRLYGDNDVLLVESSGRFALLRPGYFSWEILSPDNQLIIATPDYIWHHDRDLETVTRRPVTDTEQMSPLQVLGGDEDVLRQRFTVERDEMGGFVLMPVSGDVGFKTLTLQLEEGAVTGMHILDNLNQRVVIKLLQENADSQLTAGDFAFEPPTGADLFYYDE
jgi:outer membrane lipoprotein carrier protein